MDLMKPDLMRIEGRCYRVNPIVKSSEDYSYEQEDCGSLYSACDPDEPFDEFDVDLVEDGKYRTTFHVARVYFPYIIGGKGNTRRRIENETKTQVKVPKFGQKGDIVIVGHDRRGVCAARRRINIIVMGARLRQAFTHFLSIPMNSETIKEGFNIFKAEVLEKCKSRGIDATIFQTPEKLHLTLATIVLADNEERTTAAEVLLDCQENVIEPLLGDKALRVEMAGLEIMNDDPREVDVLYGKVCTVDGSNILQELADGIVDYFADYGGIIEKQYDRVKLHCTLMNTLFREDKGGENEQKVSKHKAPREAFDASEILQRFGDYKFGEIIVNTIHLSQRYTTSESGYYQSTVFVELF